MTRNQLTPSPRGIAALALLATLPAAPWPALAQLDAVNVEAVVSGLPVPLAATHAGDARLFVTLLDGRVMIVADGALLPRPFLDVRHRTSETGLGLYSVAFHPDHAANGYVFAHYTEAGTGDSIVSRFELREGDPDRATAASEAILLRIPKQQRLHYGGQLAFGPDGFLYVSTGEGTGQGNVVDPECAAQSLASLEGKILRLDVDAGADAAPYYAVPEDNPFVGVGRGEIWALGLRNPWRFSFDRAGGDLWIADVGQDRREEIDREEAGSPGGRNYGWKVMEGTFCFDNRRGCPATLPPCGDPGWTPPVIEYTHAGERCSVIGGHVYRGAAIPELAGRYLYGDFCTGEVWAAAPRGGGWEPIALPFTLPGLTAFGEDAEGELWLTAQGTVYRLRGADPPDGGEPCVADAQHLCLNEGRFEVSVSWRTGNGESGLGRAVALVDDAGYFWFFGPDNPELFVKVLDACREPFQRFWVFAAGLTEVETSLLVVDTETGASRRYDSALGQPYTPVRDTQAFATCP
jgi:glucose/arabinose dehydrogenase